jgi:hypothetical protein
MADSGCSPGPPARWLPPDRRAGQGEGVRDRHDAKGASSGGAINAVELKSEQATSPVVPHWRVSHDRSGPSAAPLATRPARRREKHMISSSRIPGASPPDMTRCAQTPGTRNQQASEHLGRMVCSPPELDDSGARLLTLRERREPPHEAWRVDAAALTTALALWKPSLHGIASWQRPFEEFRG